MRISSHNPETTFLPEINRLEADLLIMERFSEALNTIDEEVCDAVKRREREYKDAHLHSTPRPVKHRR
ncbi:MAG: hypothetical protein C0621_07390 [Desulfuromonas sp.]|nr:MAG: hypothetical protein C0621_07390 [Desulfuromonas sp.]